MKGGGVALLYASKGLDKLKSDNFDQKIGIQVIQNALKVKRTASFCILFIFMFVYLLTCILFSVLY